MGARGPEYKEWTDEEVEQMDLMARMGKRPQEVAEALGRTVSSIQNKAHAKCIRFVDQRTGRHVVGYRNRPKKVSDKAFAKIDPPKNVSVRERPLARGVDWAV